MVKRLQIKNYKSIKDLDLDTKRVNIFIGEHNSGKSNILEALSWFSLNATADDVFPELFRFKTAADFFFDFDINAPVEIRTDDLSFFLRIAKNKQGALLNRFEAIISQSDHEIDPGNFDINESKTPDLKNLATYILEYDGKISNNSGSLNSYFRTYIFKRIQSFQNSFRPFLDPPFGGNIPSLLIYNKEYKDLISSIFKEKGFRLMLKPVENEITMTKEINEELYSYPYQAISETMQRIIFYLLAIESNKDSVLILDEPESNTFPMYTKQLAELIADNSNQFFIATHNPYMLGSMVSKTPTKDLAVFVTKMENYETIVQQVTDERLSELLDSGADVFFNLDKLVSP